MPYSTDNDIVDRLGEERVRRLTDDANAGSIDSTRLARVREEATQIVDTYIRGRYDLPLPTPAPQLLVQIETDVLAHRLYRRRANVDIPDSVQSGYDEAMDMLKALSSGRIKLGIDTEGDGEDDSKPVYKTRGDEPIFIDKINRYIDNY